MIESAAEVEVQVELLEGEFAVILSLFTMDGIARGRLMQCGASGCI